MWGARSALVTSVSEGWAFVWSFSRLPSHARCLKTVIIYRLSWLCGSMGLGVWGRIWASMLLEQPRWLSHMGGSWRWLWPEVHSRLLTRARQVTSLRPLCFVRSSLIVVAGPQQGESIIVLSRAALSPRKVLPLHPPVKTHHRAA